MAFDILGNLLDKFNMFIMVFLGFRFVDIAIGIKL